MSSRELETEVYNVELEKMISQFNHKSFKENKDIAEIMERSINLLSKGIMLEKINIDKINSTIGLIEKNKIGNVAVLEAEKSIEDIYQKAETDFIKAKEAYDKGDYWKASFLFSQITSIYPVTFTKLDDAYYYLSLSYYNLKLYHSAKETLNILLLEIPLSEFFDKAYLLLFRVNYFLNKYEDNIVSTSEFINKFTDSDSMNLAYYYKGLSYMEMSRFEKAIEIFQEVDTLTETYYYSRYMSGICMFLKKDEFAPFFLTRLPEEEFLDNSMSEDLKAKIYLTAAQNYFELDSLHQAGWVIDSLLTGDDYYFNEKYYTRGEIYFNAGDYDKAFECFKKVTDSDEKTEFLFESYYKMIYIKKEKNEFSEAEKYYGELEELISDDEYNGKGASEIMMRQNSNEQEILLTKNKNSILDILTFDKFKYLHYTDYYNDKYQSDEYLEEYTQIIKNQYEKNKENIQFFIDENRKMDLYLKMLSSLEKVEYQNAMISYDKIDK